MSKKMKESVTLTDSRIEEIENLVALVNGSLGPAMSLSKHGVLSMILEAGIDRFTDVMVESGPVRSVIEYYSVLESALPQKIVGGQ